MIFILANCSKEDNLEVIGNWNGKETIFFCPVIDPGDNSSDAYPRMGITVPSAVEPNEFSDIPLLSLQLNRYLLNKHLNSQLKFRINQSNGYSCLTLPCVTLVCYITGDCHRTIKRYYNSFVFLITISFTGYTYNSIHFFSLKVRFILAIQYDFYIHYLKLNACNITKSLI